ncbi:hypothetical protein D9M71_792790 [compost metagenome]
MFIDPTSTGHHQLGALQRWQALAAFAFIQGQRLGQAAMQLEIENISRGLGLKLRPAGAQTSKCRSVANSQSKTHAPAPG